MLRGPTGSARWSAKSLAESLVTAPEIVLGRAQQPEEEGIETDFVTMMAPFMMAVAPSSPKKRA